MKIEITNSLKITDFDKAVLPIWRNILYIDGRNYYMEHKDAFYAPRGFLEFIIDNGVSPQTQIVDKTNETPLLFNIEINPMRKPYEFQQSAIDDLLKYDMAGLKSPAGSGKTNIACYLIQKRKVKTLFLVPTTDLVKQTYERLKEVLIFDYSNIGIFSGAKKEIKPITIGTWQSVYKNVLKFRNEFGMVIADEYHQLAYNYFLIMHSINSKYKYGISATPKRQNDNKILEMGVGKIKHQVDIEKLYQAGFLIRPNVFMIKTGVTYTSSQIFGHSEKYLTMQQKLGIFKKKISLDNIRNSVIMNVIKEKNYNCSLVLSYQREHCERLYNMFPYNNKIFIHGGFTKKKKNTVFELIKIHHNIVIFGTQSLLGTGIDIPKLENLFIVSPFAGENKTIQFAGRVMRVDKQNKNKRVNIYDFYDGWIENVKKSRNQINPASWAEKRITSYKKIKANIYK